jgi:hypothetical protein
MLAAVACRSAEALVPVMITTSGNSGRRWRRVAHAPSSAVMTAEPEAAVSVIASFHFHVESASRALSRLRLMG